MPGEVTQSDPNPNPNPAPNPNPENSGGGNTQPGGGGGKDTPQRPESVPERFWDAKEGKVKVEDLGKEYGELASFKAGIDNLAAQVPEKADGYKVELPESFETPEGLEFKLNPEDPRVKPFQEWAHKYGVPQEAFSELLAIEGKSALDTYVADKEFRDGEMQKLGEKGAERAKAVADWIDAQAPDKDAAQAGKDLLVYADGVKLFENLMQKRAGPSVVRSGAEGGSPAGDLADKSVNERMSAIGKKAMALAGVKQ